MKAYTILAVILVFAGVSCGPRTQDQSEYGRVYFNLQNQNAIGAFWQSIFRNTPLDFQSIEASGPIVIYAVFRDGTTLYRTLRLNNDRDSSPFELLSGPWKFYAVGYTGASLDSTIKCGMGNGGQSVTVEAGEDIEVPLILNEPNCTASNVTLSSFVNASGFLMPLKIHSCNPIPAGYFIDCDGGGGNVGNILSYKLKLPLYSRDSVSSSFVTTDGIVSDCISLLGLAGAAAATNLYVPLGTNSSYTTDFPFALAIDVYTANNTCAGSPADTVIVQQGVQGLLGVSSPLPTRVGIAFTNFPSDLHFYIND